MNIFASRQHTRRNVEEDAETIVRAVDRRQQTIRTLKSLAQESDNIHKGKGEGEMWTSGIGVTGGLLTIGSGIATIMTAGAAAPVIGALAMGGTATSLVGGGMSIYNTVGNCKTEAELKKKIMEIIKEDEEALKKTHHLLDTLKNDKNDDYKRPALASGAI